MLTILRQPVRAALSRRFYATAKDPNAAKTRVYIPPPPSAESKPEAEVALRPLRRPSSQTFYTGRPELYEGLRELEDALENSRRTLKALQLLPLPPFARASLQPAVPAWRNRQSMNELYDQPLSNKQYRRLIGLAAQLEYLVRVARAAGHGDLAQNVERIVQVFENAERATLLRRPKAKAPLDRFGRSYTTGARKTSSARVWLIPVQPVDPPAPAETEASMPTETETPTPAEASAPTESPPSPPSEAQSPPGFVDPFEDLIADPLAPSLRTPLKPRVPVTPAQILVNNTPLERYFALTADRERIVRPLRLAGALGAFNVFALVRGGGMSGQSGAVAHALARGVVVHMPDMDRVMRRAKLLRRDPRMVERKKPGQPKARKKVRLLMRSECVPNADKHLLAACLGQAVVAKQPAKHCSHPDYVAVYVLSILISSIAFCSALLTCSSAPSRAA